MRAANSFGKYQDWVPFFLLIVMVGWLNYLMISGRIFSDFLAHMDIWRFYDERGKVPFPPLYYLSFYALSLFVPGDRSLQIGLLILMLGAWIAKYLVSKEFLKAGGLESITSSWLSLGLILLFPVYLFLWEGEWLYFGKMTPNVWHNGSSVFVYPFCYLLFLETLKWLNSDSSRVQKLLLWGLLIVLIKPSFLFGYIPGMAVLLFLSKMPNRKKIHGAIILIFFLALIAFSKFLIFDGDLENNSFFNFNSRQGIEIRPFAVWQYLSKFPFWDLFSSFFLLIMVFLFYGNSLLRILNVQLAFLIFLFAQVVFFLFAEEGAGFGDANFYWQVPISLFILYLVLLRELWMIQTSGKVPLNKNWRMLTLIFLATSYVLSGCYYLYIWAQTGLPY